MGRDFCATAVALFAVVVLVGKQADGSRPIMDLIQLMMDDSQPMVLSRVDGPRVSEFVSQFITRI